MVTAHKNITYNKGYRKDTKGPGRKWAQEKKRTWKENERTWMEMKGNKWTWKEMKGNSRKWKEMEGHDNSQQQGNPRISECSKRASHQLGEKVRLHKNLRALESEWKWKNKKGNEMKGNEGKGTERKGKKFNRNELTWKEQKWKEMKGHEWKWKEMKGNDHSQQQANSRRSIQMFKACFPPARREGAVGQGHRVIYEG